jgi:hypothetical protein
MAAFEQDGAGIYMPLIDRLAACPAIGRPQGLCAQDDGSYLLYQFRDAIRREGLSWEGMLSAEGAGGENLKGFAPGPVSRLLAMPCPLASYPACQRNQLPLERRQSRCILKFPLIVRPGGAGEHKCPHIGDIRRGYARYR